MPKGSSSKPAQSPVPKPTEEPIDSLPTPSALEGENDVDDPSVGAAPQTTFPDLDGADVLCENLWDLQGDALPELDDLSPPSSTSAAGDLQPTNSPFAASLATDPSCLLSLLTPTLQEENHNNFSQFSPSSIVRSYPPISLSPPQRDASIPRSLGGNSSWTLIEYYFKEVAALFSSYDSQMNPFRTTVSRLWGSSLAMCRTMQSMAAATLVHDFPQFGPMGLKMRNEAVEVLTKDSTTILDDKSLLSLLMLGQTASWHDPKDLGIPFFNLLRKHLNAISSGHAGSLSSNHSKNHQFFEEALIYWEMLLSFVADNDSVALSGNAGTEDSLVLQRMPHPWTGIARDTHSAVQEVGRLVRRERKRIRTQRFTSQDGITQAQRAIDQAAQLEERLLELAHPAEAEIISPGDDETPVWHLLTMAESYRCTGLMQLYRAFPDLLRRRLPLQSAADQDPFFLSDPMLGNPNLDEFCEFPGLGSGDQNTTRTEARKNSSSYYDSWLTEFALTTLSRLRTVPIESRTRCVQPFLLVASSSELRLPQLPMTTEDETHNEPDNNPSHDNDNSSNIPSHAVEVLRTRKFVLGRLTSYLHVLPPKPIHVCLQLVREVWRRMDAGEKDVYWMDVMIAKGWETTMG